MSKSRDAPAPAVVGASLAAQPPRPGITWLVEPRGAAVLARFGIPYPDFEVAPTAAVAATAASRIGYPVVLKAVSEHILHKSDAGAVVTGVKDEATLKQAFKRLTETVAQRVPDATLLGVMVAREAPAGLEVIVGGHRDPVFGPVVAIGLGGTLVELLGEVALRLAPLSARDVSEAIDNTRIAILLSGYRRQPPLDRSALERLILASSQLMADEPGVAEFDLNPVRVYESGVLALDVRLGVSSVHGNVTANLYDEE